MIYPLVTHYASITFLMTIPILATVLGQARIAKAALAALNRQPAHDSGIKKIFFTGIALSETIALITVMSTAYLFKTPVLTEIHAYVRIGIALAIIMPAVLISYKGSFCIAQTLAAAARQPFLTNQIMSFMLITQSLMQTPVIFCAIFAFIINMQAADATTLPVALKLFSTGLMLALCSIGPCIGLSYFVTHASRNLGLNRSAFPALFSFTFISQAIIETPFLLGLVTALIMLQTTPTTILKGIALLGAAITLGCTTIPVSIASAYASSKILPGIANHPEHASFLTRLSIFCQAFIDTTAIYGLIISLLLLSI